MNDLRATALVSYPHLDTHDLFGMVFGHPRTRSLFREEVGGLAYAIARHFSGCIGVIDDGLLPDAARPGRAGESYGLILAIGTLCGLPLCRRRLVLQHAALHLAPGGGLLLVEHVRAADPVLDGQFATLARVGGQSLVTPGAITAAQHEAVLVQSGFRRAECFWRMLTVTAWIALRDQ